MSVLDAIGADKAKALAGLLVKGSLFAWSVHVGKHWAESDLLAEQLDRSKEATATALASAREGERLFRTYQQDVAATNAKSIALEAERDTLQRALAEKRKGYDALPKSLVAADCRLSAERLRHVQDTFDAAFDQATAHAGLAAPTLPTTGKTGSGRP